MEMMIAPGETGVLAAGWFAAVLDDVIVALTRLDYEGLERIERDLLATVAAREQISFPAEDGVERERQIGEIRTRQRLLGRLIESTRLNLQVLHGLSKRSFTGSDAWGR